MTPKRDKVEKVVNREKLKISLTGQKKTPKLAAKRPKI